MSYRHFSLAVVVSTAALCFASKPAEALTVQVAVNGATYDVTSFSGKYNDNSSKFALPPIGLMPWWGSESLAAQFAAQVSSALGYPNGTQSPGFSYVNVNNFLYGPTLYSKVYSSLSLSVKNDTAFSVTPFTYATATLVTPASPVTPSPVPGPLPLFGVAAAFGMSRRLRRRIQLGG